MSVIFNSVIPIFRIFDVAKADEFYLEFLGFKVDWEHRYEDDMPLYRQISRGNLIIHLSEHHGDGSPGANIRVSVDGIDGYHSELKAKKYRYGRPGVEDGHGGREMCVIDPFGNRIRFCEAKAE